MEKFSVITSAFGAVILKRHRLWSWVWGCILIALGLRLRCQARILIKAMEGATSPSQICDRSFASSNDGDETRKTLREETWFDLIFDALPMFDASIEVM